MTTFNKITSGMIVLTMIISVGYLINMQMIKEDLIREELDTRFHNLMVNILNEAQFNIETIDTLGDLAAVRITCTLINPTDYTISAYMSGELRYSVFYPAPSSKSERVEIPPKSSIKLSGSQIQVRIFEYNKNKAIASTVLYFAFSTTIDSRYVSAQFNINVTN